MSDFKAFLQFCDQSRALAYRGSQLLAQSSRKASSTHPGFHRRRANASLGIAKTATVVGKAYKPTVQAMYTDPEQFAKIIQSILAEFNGHNYDELASQYRFTRRYIERLITQSQTGANADPRDRSLRGL